MKKFCKKWELLFWGLTIGIFLGKTADADFAQTTDFGALELISCTNNVRMREPIYLGVEITPADGWSIQDVEIQVTNSQNLPIDWFVPFKQPFSDRLIYPISTVMTHRTTKPLTIEANGLITACLQDQCAPYPFHLTKTLGVQMTWIMPECDGLSQALSYTPIPMYMNKVKGWAIPNDENISVTLAFPKAPKTIQLYDADKKPIATALQVKGNYVQFALPLQTENLHFFAKTYYAYYELELPLLPKTTKIPVSHTTWLHIIGTAFIFCLFSAFPIFWSRSTKAPYKIFRKQAKQAFILIMGAGLFLCLCVYFNGILSLAFNPFNKWGTLGLMALGSIFIPAHVLLPFVFTFLAPRPYLASLQSSFEQLTFIILSTILITIPFVFQWIWAKKVFQILQNKETSGSIWWCARIPWFFWIIYTLIYL